MKKFVLLLIPILVLFYSCGDNQVEKEDFGRFFNSQGVKGYFYMYDLRNDQYMVYNPEMINKPVIPEDLFDPIIALSGIDKVQFDSAAYTFRWDGTQYPGLKYRDDFRLDKAMRMSADWYFEKLADSIGIGVVENFAKNINYGTFSGTKVRDGNFWENGELLVTAPQQLEFLKSFYYKKFPVDPTIIDTVLNATNYMKKLDYIHFGRISEYSIPDGIHAAAASGIIERQENTYFYMLYVEADKFTKKLPYYRTVITRNILMDLNLVSIGK